MRAFLPTRAIALLIGIGLVDLVATAWLHSAGKIVEMNPLMRPLLASGEWLFVLVKGLTLVLAYLAMVHYSRTHRAFVRQTCLIGSCIYASVWLIWFLAGSI